MKNNDKTCESAMTQTARVMPAPARVHGPLKPVRFALFFALISDPQKEEFLEELGSVAELRGYVELALVRLTSGGLFGGGPRGHHGTTRRAARRSQVS